MSTPIAFLGCGLVSSVGLTAPAACAAIRAKVSNPTETGFLDSGGKWILGHSVPLEKPWRGRTKLARMAALAIDECIAGLAAEDRARLPLLLCVAERERPGRPAGLEDGLFLEIERELGVRFADRSLLIPHGRVSVGTALEEARKLITEGAAPRVLIAATDSLLSWPTLRVYERQDRLLTAHNSNGFMPGEGAAAVLVGPDMSDTRLLLCGLGFAQEAATIDSGQPLRGDGLAQAIRGALAEAGCQLHELDFRITDISGEQYYFKEAALALSRVMRSRKEEFDIWHPAECIGETGAVSGLAALIVAQASLAKTYAPGPGVLCHVAGDDGKRAAAVLRYRVS